MTRAPAAMRAPEPIARWWSSKSAGDQRIVAALALTLAAMLAWWGVWQPVTGGIAATRAANARGEEALADARRMSEEIAGLARTTAPGVAADPRAELERVLSRQNLRQALTQQDWKEGRARLVFGDVNYGALVAGLEALQRESRLRVVEATLTARVEPGAVRAELVLLR